MKNASLWRDAAELPDPPDPGEEQACPVCDICPSDVTDGYTLAGEDEWGRDSYVRVNPETGCLCSPEDLSEPTIADEVADVLRCLEEHGFKVLGILHAQMATHESQKEAQGDRAGLRGDPRTGDQGQGDHAAASHLAG